MFKNYTDFINFLEEYKLTGEERYGVLAFLFGYFKKLHIKDYDFWVRAWNDGFMR